MAARETLDALDHGVLRFLTAGSVDDGKSTLIGRLLYDTRSILADQLVAIERTSRRRGQALDLSLLTDGLTAEREQGITIDVAYRFFATAIRRFIVADTPGHVQYTRNMVTAASTAQLAILLVDARHGIVEQTRRHAALVHLVGVPRLIVAVNKMDLVGYGMDRFAAIAADFRAFALRHGIGAVRCVPMSALAGDMVFWLQRAGGLLLVVLGMHMLGLITIPLFAREMDLRLEGNTSGLPRSFLIGAAFGIGMTPCVGPYLALILDLLLNENLGSGAFLLLAYAIGLGIPFLVIAAGIGGTRRVTDWLRRRIRAINVVGGTLVIVMGLLLISGQFARLPQLFNFLPLLG